MKVKQSIPADRRYTIEQFNAQFPDSDACLDYGLMEQRCPGHITFCDYCKVERKHHLQYDAEELFLRLLRNDGISDGWDDLS